MVDKAIEWCADCEVIHSRPNWNQDPYFFVRDVAKTCGLEPFVNMNSEQLRNRKGRLKNPLLFMSQLKKHDDS